MDHMLSMRALGSVTRPPASLQIQQRVLNQWRKKDVAAQSASNESHPQKTGLRAQILNHTSSMNKAASSPRRPQVNARRAWRQKLNAKISVFIPSYSTVRSQPGPSKARPQHLACYDSDVTRRKKMAPRVPRGKKPEEGW